MGTSGDANKCPACGADVPVSALLCPNCGRANVSTAFAAPSSDLAGQESGSSLFVYSPPASASTPPPSAEDASLHVSSTEIPKTVLPWETSYAPLDTPSPAAAGNTRQTEATQQPAPAQAQSPAHPAPASPGATPRQGHGPPPQWGTQTPPPEQYRQGGGYWQGPGPGQGQWQGQGQGAPPNPYRYSGGPLDSGQGGTRPAYRISDNVAFGLELLGYVGILGVGHLYAGRYKRGLIIMFAWWIVVAAVCRSLFALSSTDAGFIILFAMALPIISAFWIKFDVRTNGPTRPSSQVRRN